MIISQVDIFYFEEKQTYKNKKSYSKKSRILKSWSTRTRT
jgi:hypothetical protein